MNRKEFVRKVTDVLRDNSIRKPVYSTSHTFHISDDYGNAKDFVVKQKDKSLQFTIDDIDNVVEVCIAVISDALKRGDSISFRGFGTLGLQYHKGRKMKDMQGEWIECPPFFAPKFSFGNDLKKCAKIYEMSVNDKLQSSKASRIVGDFDGS